jgi:hypothetical protein
MNYNACYANTRALSYVADSGRIFGMATQLAYEALAPALFTYDKDGQSYRHWQVKVDGRIATVSMNVQAQA